MSIVDLNSTKTVSYINGRSIDLEIHILNFHYLNVYYLYKHTKEVSKNAFSVSTTGFSVNGDERSVLPALTMGVYSLCSTYFNNCWELIFPESKSDSFSSWFRYMSNDISQELYQDIFEAYVISEYRHKVVVHSTFTDSPGSTSCSTGDYQLWFATSHILNKEDVLSSLASIRDKFSHRDKEKYPLPNIEWVFKDFDRQAEYETYVLESLFNQMPYFKESGIDLLRDEISALAAKYGCNSHKLDHIFNVVDKFFPALYEFKKSISDTAK